MRLNEILHLHSAFRILDFYKPVTNLLLVARRLDTLYVNTSHQTYDWVIVYKKKITIFSINFVFSYQLDIVKYF